jgi:hypothetical protein
MKNGRNKPQADPDWENRKLCSDESCIGVIGPDGRCKECGKPYEGEARESSSGDQQENDLETEAGGEADDDKGFREPDEEDESDGEDDEDTDWESRTLCSDDSCIGVIGPDGRCKECGRPYET